LDQILSEHEPIPLEQAAQNEINLILQTAEQQLGE